MSDNVLNKKVAYWENQLLDLGKRNKMISYRETKRATLGIQEPEFETLFKNLVIEENSMTFQKPVDEESNIRMYSVLSLLEQLSEPIEVFIGDIKTSGSYDETKRTLKNLRSKSKLAMDEQGTNILYLSIGFIKWKEKNSRDGNWIKSPVVLVPVDLRMESINAPYTLQKQDDDVVVNPTLMYLFEKDYGITLPEFDQEEESIADYLHKVDMLVNPKGWLVERECNLGLVSFSKISMYNDLQRNESAVKANPIIRAFAGEANEHSNLSTNIIEFNHDAEKAIDTYQVVGADSSQQDAIALSKSGASFVMQGPPGTGKSQTITNIISQGLADGKKILFVSEKMAALEVVYKRLKEVHLDDFCLALHSHKANKKEVLQELGKNLEFRKEKVKNEELSNLAQLDIVKESLKHYVKDIHTPIMPLEMTLYEVYGELVKLTTLPEVPLNLENIDCLSKDDVNKLMLFVADFDKAKEILGPKWYKNPWQGLSAGYVELTKRNELKSNLELLVNSIEQIDDACNSDGRISEIISFKGNNIISEIIAALKNDEGLVAETLEKELEDSSFDILAEAVSPEFASVHKKLSERVGVETPILLSCVKKYMHVFNVLLDGAKFLDCWSDKAQRDNAILLIKDAISNSKDLETQKKEYTELYKNIGFVEGLDFLNDKEQKNIEKLKLKFLEPEKIVIYCQNDDANHLLDDIKVKQELLKAIETRIKAIKEEWGYTGETAQLYDLIGNKNEYLGIMPNSSWINNLGNVLAVATSLQEYAGELKKEHNALSKEFEDGIFDLNYMAILNRFKLEYTNIFKHFKSSYKKDVKSVRALYREVKGKVTDQEIIAVLQRIRAYDEQVNRYFGFKKAVSQYFDVSDYDMNFDWEDVIARIKKFDELSKSFTDMEKTVSFVNYMLENLTVDDYVEMLVLEEWFSNNSVAEMYFGSLYNGLNTRVEEIKRYYELAKENKTFFISDKHYIEFILNNENADAIANKLNAIHTARSWFEKNKFNIKTLLDIDYVENESCWESVQADLCAFITLISIVGEDMAAGFIHMNETDTNLLEEYNFAGNQYIGKLNNITNIVAKHSERFYSIAKLFENTDELSELPLVKVQAKFKKCSEEFDTLDAWIDFRECKQLCEKNGLGEFIKEADFYIYNSGILADTFLKNFYFRWLEKISLDKETIANFKVRVQEGNVDRFKQLDNRQLPIAQLRIREKLIADMPSRFNNVRAADEMSTLLHELGKKRKIMPLRKLFKTIPNLLLKLKPCLMMSPLSVAHFLETDTYKFDMVIFDEASQIFPQDAIGAIFRGTQVIIAGDSKQLPPTNFFAASTSNDGDYDGDYEDEEDIVYDSILEEATNSLPNRSLLWHYRSRNEDLISFSNQKIYNNNLITFPSNKVREKDSGVEYIFVQDGIYDNRCNVKEAEKCVELVIEHFKNHPNRSLGVIAFSESQQSQIEEAIYSFRQKNPKYEKFFDENREEAFFVKNLENVQGDERDTIIFSICYGKNKEGRMYMRFGPLGHQGGERRLNVAITRAKHNVKLVGSILPEDIDLKKTKSEGVQMLRAYINFAMLGNSTLAKGHKTHKLYNEDVFCNHVAEFIKQHGYEIETNVGNSDYTVDIAIKDPKNENRYFAGVECDGESYYMAKTVRDREQLRTAVLERMGWQMYRVWSTEWIRNPEAEKKRLLDFLKKAQMGDFANDDDVPSSANIETEIIETTAKPALQENKSNPYNFKKYVAVEWWELKRIGNSDRQRIANFIRQTLQVEQPMHVEVLYRRLAGIFGNEKATKPVRDSIDVVMKNELKNDIKRKGDFVYLSDMKEMPVRRSHAGSPDRNIEHIFIPEIAKAMTSVLQGAYGMEKSVLVLETARIFGFEKTGTKIRTIMSEAIDYLENKQMVTVVDDKVQLV